MDKNKQLLFIKHLFILSAESLQMLFPSLQQLIRVDMSLILQIKYWDSEKSSQLPHS